MRHNWHNWLLLAPFLLGQFGFDFGDNGSGDISTVDFIIAQIIGVISYIWAVLVAVANFIFSVLQFIWKFLTTLFADISKAFKWIWQRIIKEGLTKLLKAFVNVRAWLQKIFGPLICYLRAALCWFDWAFNKFVKPILNAIQHIRQVLTLFRLLGFKWAKKLDDFLAKIQRDILKVYTTIRAELNKVISVVQIIADPNAILRRNPLFAGLIRSLPELKNALYYVDDRQLTSAEEDAQARDRANATAAGQKSNFQTYYSQGRISPEDEAARKQFAIDFECIRNG